MNPYGDKIRNNKNIVLLIYLFVVVCFYVAYYFEDISEWIADPTPLVYITSILVSVAIFLMIRSRNQLPPRWFDIIVTIASAALGTLFIAWRS